MQHWKTEDLQRLVNEREPWRMFEMSVDLAKTLGMPYIHWKFYSNVPGKPPEVTHYDNYPAAWKQIYEERFLQLDPIPHKCRNSVHALLWEDSLFEDVPELRELAQAHGLRHGWTQSVYDLH